MSAKQVKVIREIPPLSDSDCLYIADRSKSEFTYPMHRHMECELNFIENASGVRRVVGDSVEIIGDYDLVLIASNDLEHGWEQADCTSEKVREITVQFSSDLVNSNFTNKKQFDSIRELLERARKGVAFPIAAILKVYHMLDALSSEKDGFYAVMKFFTILYELSLCENYKVLSSSPFAKTEFHSNSGRVQRVREYINNNFKSDIRLPLLAEMAGMSPVAFSRFFKMRTGKNLSEYIIDIRLGYAASMLVDSSNSIAEISCECGFNNLSNFNRIFKKKKKCSPKEFRENFKKNKKVV